MGSRTRSRGISGHNAPRLELTIGPGGAVAVQRKGVHARSMGCFIGAHNVPHRGRVESPWVMPPRRDGEPGKGLEELADITRRDWS